MRKIVIDSARNNLPVGIYTTLIHAIEKDDGIIIISTELYEVIIEELHRQKKTPTQLALFKLT